ncbi:MAG: hypothetical protein ACE5FW_00010 [Candidatus Aenigmatarchaeota archaeon]
MEPEIPDWLPDWEQTRERVLDNYCPEGTAIRGLRFPPIYSQKEAQRKDREPEESGWRSGPYRVFESIYNAVFR